jgi:hypothetical protein
MAVAAGVMVVVAADETAIATEALAALGWRLLRPRARGLLVKYRPDQTARARHSDRAFGAMVAAHTHLRWLAPAPKKHDVRPKSARSADTARSKKAAGPKSGGLIKSSGNCGRGSLAIRINGPFR